METKKLTNRQKTLRLTESALMIALSTVLSMVPITNLPFGGSVTMFSQLPIVIIAYRHGTKWGLFTGLCHGILQMLLGFNNFSYVTGIAAVLILALCDYLIAFSCLGLGGIFRNKIKNRTVSLALGALLVSVIRFICHFISGVTIWSGYAEGMSVWLYSLTYNSSYMVPEALVTVIGAVLIAQVKPLFKQQGDN